MAWVVPIGTPAGICSGFEGMDDGCGVVRLGNELVYLDPGIYRLWLAAMAAPAPAELVAWAPGKGITEAEEHVPALLSEGLLISDGGDVETRVGRLAMRLIGHCSGNGPDRAPTFGVVGTRGAQLDLDMMSFEALLRADGCEPLASSCGAVDAAHPQASGPSTLARIVEALPLLVRVGVIRLNAVPAG